MQKSKLQFKIQKPSLYRRGERRERSSLRSFKFLAVVFSFSFFALSFAIPVSAIELFFEPRTQELGVGQKFQVDLMIDAQGKEINAVAASVVFPEEFLEVRSIEDGGSILTLWVERPLLKNGVLSFAGVIPGGFKGIMGPFEGTRPGKILSLTVMTTKEGAGEFVLKDVQVLLHDGKGTPTKSEISNFKFLISKQIPITQILIPETDDIPPEPFFPEIARYPDMFEGKWFLVFATQDKGSGIAYYAIHETRRKKEVARIDAKDWIETESPYILKDQKLRSYIFVKAVDKAGNERIAVVEPRYLIKWYEIWWVWGIMILTVAVIIFIVIRIRKTKCLKI